MNARVDITPESIQHAATNLATGQQHLADAWMRLDAGLDANASRADKHGSAIKYPFARVYPNVSMGEPGSARGQGGSGLPGPLGELEDGCTAMGEAFACATPAGRQDAARHCGVSRRWCR